MELRTFLATYIRRYSFMCESVDMRTYTAIIICAHDSSTHSIKAQNYTIILQLKILADTQYIALSMCVLHRYMHIANLYT